MSGYDTLNFGYIPTEEGEIASYLRNTSGLVQINLSGPPVAGQALVATDANNAIWASPPENQTLEEVLVEGNTTGAHDIIAQQRITMPLAAAPTTTNLLNVTTITGPPTSSVGVNPGALVFDDTNNDLYFFNGTAWVQVYDKSAGNVPTLQEVTTAGATTNVATTFNSQVTVTGQFRPQGVILNPAGDVTIQDNLVVTQDIDLQGGLTSTTGSPSPYIDIKVPLKNQSGGDLVLEDGVSIVGNLQVSGGISTISGPVTVNDTMSVVGAATFQEAIIMDTNAPANTTKTLTLVGTNGVPTGSVNEGSLSWDRLNNELYVNTSAGVGTTWTKVGKVTSVGLAAPTEFTVSGSPVTGSGTLTLTKAAQNANFVWAGPTTGGPAAPTFRALVAADVPAGVGLQNLNSVLTQGNTTGALDIVVSAGQKIDFPGPVRIGNNANPTPPTGGDSVTIGRSAGAMGSNSVAIGFSASTSANYGQVAVGEYAIANGIRSTAIGPNSNAFYDNATAIGGQAVAGHAGSTAIGFASTTSQANQIMLGTYNTTTTNFGKFQMDRNLAANSENLLKVSGHIADPTSAPFGFGGEIAFNEVSKKLFLYKGFGAWEKIEPTLARVLIEGNTTGANDIVISSPQRVSFAENKIKISGSAAIAAGGTNSVLVGINCLAVGNNSVAIGYTASVGSGASDSLAIGSTALVVAGHNNSVAIGPGSTTTAANQIMLGGASNTTKNIGKFEMPNGAAASTTSHLKITGTAGVPTGNPSAYGGQLAYDESTGKIYLHAGGGTWNDLSSVITTPTLNDVLSAGNTSAISISTGPLTAADSITTAGILQGSLLFLGGVVPTISNESNCSVTISASSRVHGGRLQYTTLGPALSYFSFRVNWPTVLPAGKLPFVTISGFGPEGGTNDSGDQFHSAQMWVYTANDTYFEVRGYQYLSVVQGEPHSIIYTTQICF